jgi:hypothetical protein
MNYFEVYNFLDGNNLCNIFANLLVNKYEELSPNSKTEIKVINLRNFFVVRGVTSCEEVCNITELFQNFVSKFKSEMTQDIRVINLMTHNPDFDFKTINISHSSDAYINNQTSEFTEFVNSFSSNNIYFNLKINTVTKHILYDCVDDSTAKVIDILENKFKDFQLLKYDMSNEIYFSDSFIIFLLFLNISPFIVIYLLLSNVFAIVVFPLPGYPTNTIISCLSNSFIISLLLL